MKSADRGFNNSVLARRATVLLLLLAVSFYACYGLANWLASQRVHVPEVSFAWESHIPFWDWTIIPYWSLNLFYALALFTCTSRNAQNLLAGRYLTAQLIACVCFILFPLTISWQKTEATGFSGFLFAMLGNFDQPFNQAPSLHIALLIIIWDQIRTELSKKWQVLWHFWCLLIALSVLTTWQHHFIDVPTGALLGLFALWLFPKDFFAPWREFRLTGDRHCRKLALIYSAGGIGLIVLTIIIANPLWLILLWPALGLLLLGFGYSGAGVKIFQKNRHGHASFAAYWLFMPLRPLLWLNRIAWTWQIAPSTEIAPDIYLGRFPASHEAAGFASIIDMTGEFIKPRKVQPEWQSFPFLDMAPPQAQTVQHVLNAMEHAPRPLLLCCALGLQRSAHIAAHWLIQTGQAADYQEAIALLHQAGRPVRLKIASKR